MIGHCKAVAKVSNAFASSGVNSLPTIINPFFDSQGTSSGTCFDTI